MSRLTDRPPISTPQARHRKYLPFLLTILLLALVSDGDGIAQSPGEPGEAGNPVAGNEPEPGDPAGGASPEDPPSGWLAQVQRDLADQEYDLSWQGEAVPEEVGPAWHAPNRAHDFRTYFTPDGIRLVPRSGSAPAWRWGFSLEGYGRGDTSWPVPAASLAPAGHRIGYGRGAMEEWYVNTPEGLEQGFTLLAPPDETRSAAEPGRKSRAGLLNRRSGARGAFEPDPARLVHLDLALWGDLLPRLAEDGQAFDFVTPGGRQALRYARLEAIDARGVRLPSWIEGYVGEGRGGIRLVLDDREAIYPLSIDSLATSPAWTAESNQASANFGWSVATAGDVNGDGYSDVLVGAYHYDNGQTDEGRAYLYLGAASGPGSTPAWTGESNQASAYYGVSVATAGDVNRDGYADVIVGAYLYDNGQSNEGRAFVYLGLASGLSPTAAWTAEGDQASAYFGYSVGPAGDVNGDGYSDVVVGAYLYDNGQSNEGRVFVYPGSASGLSPAAAWTVESNQASAYFGWSVGTAGDVNGDGYSDIIVGAYLYDAGQTDEGRAFLFSGSASGLSTTPAWTGESNQASADFGWSVATAGDVNGDGYSDVIVGAHHYDGGQTDEGRVFVYLGSPSGLSATAGWTAESDQASAYFGASVGTAGDVNGDGYADLVIGAYQYDGGQSNEGRAWVYLGSASGPGPAPVWTVESNQASADFGYSVATAGDVNGDGCADVLVGAYQFDNGQTDEGGTFIFLGSANGLTPLPSWTAGTGQVDDGFSYSLGTAGDVNGDGYSDVIVGAMSYDSGQLDEGRAFVYLGSATGLSPVPAWTAESNQASAVFGAAVGTAGDVNGDGYGDVIIGAMGYDNGQSNEGRAYVYLGSAIGLSAAPVWTTESNQTSAMLGAAVGTAGDVNGDGFSDIIVGADYQDYGYPDEGRAFVYLGTPSGVAPAPSWSGRGEQADSHYGYSVGTAGDVNGDGYADVIVGALWYDGGQMDEGRAMVYLGSAAGLSLVPAWTAESNQEGAVFGEAVGTAGDANGDGYSEVIVGAHRYDNGQQDEGRAYLYYGSPAGLATSPGWTAEGDLAGASFGGSVGTAGDVNGDGYSDVVLGASSYTNPQQYEGRAYLYYGSPAGLLPGPAWSVESDQQSALFGASVGTAGDVNGDGYSDIIVGTLYYYDGQVYQGRASTFYGNGGGALSVRPQQRRADDSAPVAPGGRSFAPGSFRLAALGRTPFGRGKVRLEWELQGAGTLFDGGGTQTGANLLDTGVAGVALNELVSGVEPGGYHWRARIRYDSASVPFATTSRWFTVPWNGWEESDLTLIARVGGTVWSDLDGDGIRDGGEPGLAGVQVQLQYGAGGIAGQTATSGDGAYFFELLAPGSFRVQFVPLSGYAFTIRDQGADDTLDSDPDAATGLTDPMGSPFTADDSVRWSAGLRQCIPPALAVQIASVRTGPLPGEVTLDLADPNSPGSVTGYNEYRTTNPAQAPGAWTKFGNDTADADPSTPGIQWVDQSGTALPLGSVFYYQATAFNHVCSAEGPR